MKINRVTEDFLGMRFDNIQIFCNSFLCFINFGRLFENYLNWMVKVPEIFYLQDDCFTHQQFKKIKTLCPFWCKLELILILFRLIHLLFQMNLFSICFYCKMAWSIAYLWNANILSQKIIGKKFNNYLKIQF